MSLNSISTSEYNTYYQPYIDAINEDIGICEGLKQNQNSVVSFFLSIPKEKHSYAYAEGKWTIKDVLLHVIDTERIFTYRALRVARRDKTILPGFEHDDYVVHAGAKNRSFDSLLEEYKAVRQATLTLFSTFDAGTLKLIGNASGSPISVRAIGYILLGHENHHIKTIKERYL
ncbi:DinB family protein [Winogradskyella sp. F6397]|uniref:DinB family protein n=1 Tax=Winogradskyella marina TaxID=2785530 RepID=A0ABS0EGK1_9FLAO|nr:MULTISPECIES: DinB family protein [Winogradskyella]MBF8149575.1 DinB family protein [Winogradskyella marina]